MKKEQEKTIRLPTDNKRIVEFYTFGKKTIFKKCCGEKMIKVGVTKEYDYTNENYPKGRKEYQNFWNYRFCSQCGKLEKEWGSLRSMYHIIIIPKLFKQLSDACVATGETEDKK